MKDKGFTLAELLGVIVILGLISMIAVPAVNQSIKRYKAELLEVQINNIITSAKNWGVDHLLELPDSEGQTYTITIKMLQQEGYIGKDIKNPSSKKPISDDTVITIKRVGKGYEYSLDESKL